MVLHARYVHTNLTARDGAKLAAFYPTVFGCVPVVTDPEGNLLELQHWA